MTDWNEPRITINGTELSVGQAMTFRVAVGAFAMQLSHEGLGDDEHGVAMRKAYMARCREIQDLMMGADHG